MGAPVQPLPRGSGAQGPISRDTDPELHKLVSSRRGLTLSLMEKVYEKPCVPFSLHLSTALGGSRVGAECPQLLLRTLHRERHISPAVPRSDCHSQDDTLASLGSRTPFRPHCPHLGFLLQELDWGVVVTASIHLPGQLAPHPQGAPEQRRQPQYILGAWKEQNPL